MRLHLALVLIALTTTPLAVFADDAPAPIPRCQSVFTLGGIDFANLDHELPSKLSLKDLHAQQPGLRFSNDLLTREGREEFHDAHPFMAFVSIGDRLLLVSRNPRVLEQFSYDLSTGDNVFGDTKPRPIQIRELPGYKAFDISKASYLTPEIRASHGKHAWDDGPNCWNLCQIYKGWAKTAFATDGAEFGFWVDGPFSKPAKSSGWGGFEPKKGDVIVFRARGFQTGKMGEVHGAISLGAGLVYTKNGTNFSARYQVTTFQDMMSVYLPRLSNSIQFREIRPFDEVWAEWGPKVSPELAGFVNRWIAFEREHGEIYLPTQESTMVPRDVVNGLNKTRAQLKTEIGAVVKERLQKLEGRELTESEKVEQFFWRMLEARTETAFYH